MTTFNKKFRRDLSQGKYYEQKALDLFDYDSFHQSAGYCKEYDFWFEKDNKRTYVEVKSERYASITSNLAIEFEYKGNPSGIDITKADFYVYYILHTGNGTVRGDIKKEECYIIPTDVLKDVASKCRIAQGGDGYNSKMHLVHKALIKKYLHHVEIIDDVDDICDKLTDTKISS